MYPGRVFDDVVIYLWASQGLRQRIQLLVWVNWLNHRQGSCDLLHCCANHHSGGKHNGDGGCDQQIAVSACFAASKVLPTFAGNPQGQGEGNRTPETADPHHHAHVVGDLSSPSAQVQQNRQWKNVCRSRHNYGDQRKKDAAAVPMKPTQRQCCNNSQVHEDASLRQLGDGAEDHLRGHLGWLREIVPIVVCQDNSETEEGCNATQTKQLCHGKREVCTQEHPSDFVVRKPCEVVGAREAPGKHRTSRHTHDD
mmetsp:Transcript_13528/g.29839  ORF Transcript_13528/g.29839 Transcript_13528/m.29839 type:complete len:253 (+) Transcript_13528:261-1019(+)